MDAYGTARLAAKDAESAIVARICEDFNLTPVLARAHYEQMARYFADYGHMAIPPGELCYLAVAASEPPGKPIAACARCRCRWSWPHPGPRDAADEGAGGHAPGTTRPPGPPGPGPRRPAHRRGPRLPDVLVDGDGQAGPGRLPGGRHRRPHQGPDTGHRPRGVPQGPGGAAVPVGAAVQ